MLMSRGNHYQSGVSLVELMVGIAVGLILLAGVITLVLRISVSGGESVQATRLNQQLRSNLDFIVKDLERAGYVDWFDLYDANDDGVIDENDDTYTGSEDTSAYINILDFYASTMGARNLFGAVELYDSAGNTCITDCACVLYSYDLNGDGLQGVGGGTPGANQNTANYELFGVRSNNGQIETLTDGAHSCTGGTWDVLTAQDVTITDLSFDLVYIDPDDGSVGDATVYDLSYDPSDGVRVTDPGLDTDCTVSVTGDYPGEGDNPYTVCHQRRKIHITLEGQLASDDSVQVSLETDVKLNNDFLQTR